MQVIPVWCQVAGDSARGAVAHLVSTVLQINSMPFTVAEQGGKLLVAVAGQDVLYHDVPIDAWFTPYVSSLIQNGVAQGYKNSDGSFTGEFGVGKSVTNAEILKMALEAGGKKPAGGSPRNTSAKDSWASSYVKEAENEKLSAFVPTLNINLPATRGSIVQTILEVMGIPIGTQSSTFIDVPDMSPYARAIAAAQFYGLIQGDTDSDGKPVNTFRPGEPINRAEAAKIIALARELLKK